VGFPAFAQSFVVDFHPSALRTAFIGEELYGLPEVLVAVSAHVTLMNLAGLITDKRQCVLAGFLRDLVDQSAKEPMPIVRIGFKSSFSSAPPHSDTITVSGDGGFLVPSSAIATRGVAIRIAVGSGGKNDTGWESPFGGRFRQ
jgi:hypothetical protein